VEPPPIVERGVMAPRKFGNKEKSLVRVLVVEDFAPFRKFICLTLGNEPGVQIIAEVPDRQEAVQKRRS